MHFVIAKIALQNISYIYSAVPVCFFLKMVTILSRPSKRALNIRAVKYSLCRVGRIVCNRQV